MLDPKSVPLSPARRAGNLLFLSGQVAFDEAGRMVPPDIEMQTRQVFRNIEAVLGLQKARPGRTRQAAEAAGFPVAADRPMKPLRNRSPMRSASSPGANGPFWSNQV